MSSSDYTGPAIVFACASTATQPQHYRYWIDEFLYVTNRCELDTQTFQQDLWDRIGQIERDPPPSKSDPARWFDCFRTPLQEAMQFRPSERLQRLRRGSGRADALQARRHKRKRFLEALRG